MPLILYFIFVVSVFIIALFIIYLLLFLVADYPFF